jgi:hypothetical protein
MTSNNLLHNKCEVAKLGTAVTGNFLPGERERDFVQHCQIKQHFRVAKKILNLLKCGGAGGGGDSGGLTLAMHGYPHLVQYIKFQLNSQI